MPTGDGRDSVVSASELKSEDPGFDPALVGAGRVRGSFFYPSESTLVQTCLCRLTPFVCTARTQKCAHVKDPISICCKRVGLTAGGMVTHKYCIH